MKRIIKYMISCALPVLFSGIAQAQMTAVDTVCKGENICLTTPAFRGNIQWQSSVDAITWANIVGATNDTACVAVNANTYYRGVILENTCDTFLTDTSYIMVHNFERSVTFNFTGALQTFTVPADICDTLFIQCWGAQGSNGGGVASGIGGLGGYAEGFLIVNPGDILNVLVGGSAGFNGGGTGGNIGAGNGGGASDIRIGGTGLINRVITAGGGGGGGSTGCVLSHAGGNGGGGGGLPGTNGTDSPFGGGGFQGTLGTGGAAGIGCGGFLGSPGLGSGNGGNGQGCCCATTPGGGGGGGGFVNGGGGGGGSAGTVGCSGNDKGGGGGGAGGSSDVSGVINGTTVNNIWLGNGQITISY